MPLRLEYFSGWVALLLFVALALPIVALGQHSLAGLGTLRKWVAICLRLLVLLLLILILGGIRLQKQAKDVEVMVLRDISESTGNVQAYPGKTLQGSIDDYLTDIDDHHKPAADRMGEISFQQDALIDSLPNTHLSLESKSIRGAGTGTDIAAAVQLGLATLSQDAMHRLLLVSDGNANLGDTQAAVAAAVSQHVPIDVMPLHYDIQHEVLMDRFVAPTWKRENEPFTLDIILQSKNTAPVTGKLTVLHQGVPMKIDPDHPDATALNVTLQPGLNPFHVRVPPLQSQGVHQFHASFDPDPGASRDLVSTIISNKSADAFTFVRGRGQILYVDNVETPGGGNLLFNALNSEGVQITPQNHITPDQFPSALVQLQNYDAIILANVPYGPGGLSEDQQHNLATYVHDMGGGLLMIGGPDTFGAGGWQGRKLEEVLPVNMDIPAQRQIPKGALVLVMHACEAPDGNYLGEQCAIKAIETLSAMDDIGIVSWSWNGGGSQWDFPLAPKGDGSKPTAAAKAMQMADMMSFEDCMSVTLYGSGTSRGIKDSDARQKHVIIISDGDPQAPSVELIKAYQAAKVSVSTVTVYPHMGGADGLPPEMKHIADELHGKAYGPITGNLSQVPQIFVKEATVVRRSLITEDDNGIPLKRTPSSSDMIKGLTGLPPVRGMVLTSRKNNPQIDMPLVAGKNNDPMLATWQTGLGRAAVYTSDATNLWGSYWIASPDYSKFFSQVVRGVARPPMSNLFDINTTQSGGVGHVTVTALDPNSGFQNFLNIAGKVAGPDPDKAPTDVRLVQTGPGRYEGTFNTPDPGTYVAAMQYRGNPGPNGEPGPSGMLLGGLAMNDAPEQRDLTSNDAALADIAGRTGGRVLPAFDPANADLFDRVGLAPAIAPLPIWQTLLPILAALILLDVACRRIAWDAAALRRYAGFATGAVRNFTNTTRTVETRNTLDALQRVRTGETPADLPKPAPPATRAAAKFQPPPTPTGSPTDITQSLGGATAEPTPPPPPKPAPPQSGGGMGSLMEAKRRAQQQIRDKEKGEGQ